MHRSQYDSFIGIDPPEQEQEDYSDFLRYQLRVDSNGTKLTDSSNNLSELVAKYNEIVDGVHEFPERYEVFTAVIFDYDKDTNIYSYDIHEDRA